MNSPRTALLFLLLISALTASAAGQDRIGEISYLEDEVTVVRNNRTLGPEEVEIGMEVQNLDLLKTNKTGHVEISLEAPRAAVVKVSPGTTFYLELNSLGKDKRTTVGAITGNISVKLQKLAANQQVNVVTESALMGARGTVFEVTLSPAGDLLVICSEGQVVCTDEQGQAVNVEPGTVAEQRSGEGLLRVPVAVSDLESFRRDWYAERLDVFKANPRKAILFYALRYRDLRERFNKAFAALAGERQLLNKWYEEDRRGQVGGNMEILREKKRIIGHLLELRKTLFLLERVYYRLSELQEYYRQGYGEGVLQGSLTAKAFFQAFDRDRDELARKMTEVRYLTKLYAKRNGGAIPTDRAEEGEGEFFGDESLGEEEDL